MKTSQRIAMNIVQEVWYGHKGISISNVLLCSTNYMRSYRRVVNDTEINFRYHSKHHNETRICRDNNKIASSPLVMVYALWIIQL